AVGTLAAARLQVLADGLLDVPLEPRLRPAALFMLPGLLLRPVDDLLEPAGAEVEHLAALAVHDRDEGAVAVAGEIDERRQPQPAAEMDVVADGAWQRQHTPQAVGAGDEDGEPAGPGAGELVAPPLAGPL